MGIIATYSKVEEAYVAGSFLEANGVPFAVRDENMVTTNWLYSAAIGGVKLEVDDADMERARELLELPVERDIILQCPYCGSGNTRLRELSVLTAAMIGFLGFIFPARSVTVDCLDCKRSFKQPNDSDTADLKKDSDDIPQ